MPKITFSKESLEPKPPIPDGLYEVRLEGFEPKYSKDRTSINLNPVLKIINHPTETGRRVFDNLNSSAAWIIEGFTNAFGLELVSDGSGGFNIPGDFNGPEDNPEQWSYTGPLTGCVAKVFLKRVTYNGKESSKIDQWFNAVPGSTKKSPSGLAR